MTILAAITIIICVFIAALFGSAAAVMISREIAEKKLKKQEDFYFELDELREEFLASDKKLNAKIFTLNVNQQVLENKLVEFLNKK